VPSLTSTSIAPRSITTHCSLGAGYGSLSNSALRRNNHTSRGRQTADEHGRHTVGDLLRRETDLSVFETWSRRRRWTRSLQPVREALDRILQGHLPYPAVVVRPYGELVAANTAIAVLTQGAADHLLAQPINVLRLALHPDGLARRVENLPEWGRHIIESLRAQALRSPDDRLDAFITELERYPPLPNGPDHVGFAVPLRLHCDEREFQLITTLTSFATAVDVTLAELHLEAFLPADEASAEILRHRAQR
jgi:hypothetical protein